MVPESECPTMRALTALALYALTFALFYGATTMAPSMTWPNTPLEMQAASMLVLGCIAKMVAHVVLMGYSRRA